MAWGDSAPRTAQACKSNSTRRLTGGQPHAPIHAFDLSGPEAEYLRALTCRHSHKKLFMGKIRRSSSELLSRLNE